MFDPTFFGAHPRTGRHGPPLISRGSMDGSRQMPAQAAFGSGDLASTGTLHAANSS